MNIITVDLKKNNPSRELSGVVNFYRAKRREIAELTSAMTPLSNINASRWEDSAEYRYAGSRSCPDQLARYIMRMNTCGSHLLFAHLRQPNEWGKEYKLYESRFCRVRVCPLCQWRRALRLQARLHRALKELDNDGGRWIFLTLSLKTAPIGGIRSELSAISSAWQRFTQLAEFRQAFVGYIRNVEITESNGRAHPHLHVLLLTKSDYFTGGGYINQKRFVEMWRQSARVDYSPSAYVEAVPEMDLPNVIEYAQKNALRGVFGYSTKGEAFSGDSPEYIKAYIENTSHMRFFSSGGCIRAALAKISRPADDDIVDVNMENMSIFKDVDINVDALHMYASKVEDSRSGAGGHAPERGANSYLYLGEKECVYDELPPPPETVKMKYGEYIDLRDKVGKERMKDIIRKYFTGVEAEIFHFSLDETLSLEWENVSVGDPDYGDLSDMEISVDTRSLPMRRVIGRPYDACRTPLSYAGRRSALRENLKRLLSRSRDDNPRS